MQLFNDDCLNVLKTLESNSVDLVVTDPPYKVGTQGGLTNSDKHWKDHIIDIEDNNIHDGYDIRAVNIELVRVMKNINIYIFCNKAQIMEYMNFYVTEYHCLFDILIWHKSNITPLFNCRYLDDFEFCLYFHKGGYGVKPDCYADASKYYCSATNNADKDKYGHPTIKPLDFIERLIRNSSMLGNVVLDPFMGSGTTGVAAKDLGREFIGIEIEKKWYDIAKDRIEREGTTVDSNIAIDLSQFI